MTLFGVRHPVVTVFFSFGFYYLPRFNCSICLVWKLVSGFLDTRFTIHYQEETCSENDLCFLQSGHNIAQVREKMRELIKQIILTYSAAKTFPYILEGLRSRNNRTRIECVDLVGFLLENHGSEVKFVTYFKHLFRWIYSEENGVLSSSSTDWGAIEILANSCKLNI